ncbi:MAG: catechol 2,3-dioxygenase [Patescibacteria group bacterium]|nr:catechol 2,3-dioxygenase [Patescibacteria group bacterium]
MTKIKIKELGHIVLYVRDLEQSTNFYSDVLGWKKLPRQPGMPAQAFSSGRTHHELLLIEVGDQAADKVDYLQLGLYHFGLKIGDTDEELKTAIEQLQKKGVTITGTANHHVTHSVYIADPDGNQIELYIDVAGVNWHEDESLILQPTRKLDLG